MDWPRRTISSPPVVHEPAAGMDAALSRLHSLDATLGRWSITHVVYSGLGGHAAVLFGLLDGGFLRAASHRIVFFGVEPPPADYARRCEERGAAWTYVPKLPRRGHLSFLLRLQRAITAGHPQFVFMHGVTAVPALAIRKLLPRRRSFSAVLRETQANHLKSAMDWLLLGLAHLFADRIVHLSTDAMESARARLLWICRRSKVTIIPNGIDTDFFSPAYRLGLSDGILRIGMQSRLQENKDHRTLLMAFALLRARHPRIKMELHIAGAGLTFDPIVRLGAELDLGEALVMHGMLDVHALVRFLRTLDVYVHCTHGETMSTAIMQSLSCGLPVIASDVDGVSNMLVDNVGLLHRPGDPEHLAGTIERLLDPEERKAWSVRAREFAVRQFGIHRMVSEYERLTFECMEKTCWRSTSQ